VDSDRRDQVALVEAATAIAVLIILAAIYFGLGVAKMKTVAG
jgi:hypothetical protein